MCTLHTFSLITGEFLWQHSLRADDDDYNAMNVAFDGKGNTYLSEAGVLFSLNDVGNVTHKALVPGAGHHDAPTFYIGLNDDVYVQSYVPGVGVQVTRYQSDLWRSWTSPVQRATPRLQPV